MTQLIDRDGHAEGRVHKRERHFFGPQVIFLDKQRQMEICNCVRVRVQRNHRDRQIDRGGSHGGGRVSTFFLFMLYKGFFSCSRFCSAQLYCALLCFLSVFTSKETEKKERKKRKSQVSLLEHFSACFSFVCPLFQGSFFSLHWLITHTQMYIQKDQSLLHEAYSAEEAL